MYDFLLPIVKDMQIYYIWDSLVACIASVSFYYFISDSKK